MTIAIGDLEPARHTTMDVARMREILADELERIRVRKIRRPDTGEDVPVSAEELSSTVVVERDGQRAVGVRVNYELAYREFRFPQTMLGHLDQGPQFQGGAPAKFRAFVRYQLGAQLKALELYQPGLEWALVYALVDPVCLTRTYASVDGREPTAEEASIRLAQAVQSMQPSSRAERPPERLSRVMGQTYQEQDWVWYVRLVFADVSGGADWQDPNVVGGGESKGLSKYAETRQLRYLPRGTRKQRERAIELMTALDKRPVQVAPASKLSPAQRATAVQMLNEGTNVALIARLMDMSPEDLAAELPLPEAKAAAKVRGRKATLQVSDPPLRAEEVGGE